MINPRRHSVREGEQTYEGWAKGRGWIVDEPGGAWIPAGPTRALRLMLGRTGDGLSILDTSARTDIGSARDRWDR